MRSPLLTIVLPTRDRPDGVPGQLRLFRDETFHLVIGDSSERENAARIRAAAAGIAEFRALPPQLTLYDKLALMIEDVETPFVLVLSDRKINFPHAVHALLAHLLAHEDHIAAQGYILGFASCPDAIDINRVVWFTPTIGEDDPLQRHYHLMRRYQSRAFGVFRVAPLRRAVAQARRVAGAVFQETLLMNALALQGKLARVPTILTLQSEERSFHLPNRNDPLYWFLDDAESFLEHYRDYRGALTDFMRELGLTQRPAAELNRLVDVIHAVWLRGNFDCGVLNHAARLLLGDAMPPLPGPGVSIPWREPGRKDVIRQGVRRYVWRDNVLRAEPRDEIHISEGEVEQVSKQLDVYFG